jgi:tetratricopeptide (TPR) repeat protein
MKNEWRVLVGVCVVVVGIYGCAAHTDPWESPSQSAADCYYNLLVQGFRAGHLSLKKDVPPGLTQLADPYDPGANALYRAAPYCLHDLSYYKGRLYLYFGVTPALIFLWPFVALTGHYLFSGQTSAIFCAVGFLAGAGVLRALWRRYFPEVSVWVVATGTLAFGLGAGVPLMLPRSGVYEVAVSCGYMLTMLSLGAIWCALHEPERRQSCWWLAAASAAYGLAVAARPSLLFGAIILLVPVVQARQERRPVWALLAAGIGPITFIGLGMMLYNAMRFDSPFEFGLDYILAAFRPIARQYFRWRYLWFNFRVYFFEPVRWSARFPFVHEISVPPSPAGYARVEAPFGVLTNSPLVWLALAVPLAWRRRSGQEASTLRWFVTGVALLLGTCVLTLLFFESATIRYEVEFLPTLVLLAAVGVLGLDRALAERLAWRRAARFGWGLLLGFSVAFNLFASVVRYAEADNDLGAVFLGQGKVQEAMSQFEQTLRLEPDCAQAHNNLGIALAQTGSIEEAIAQCEQALQIKPDFAEAHNNLGAVFLGQGRLQEAISHYEQALRIKPDYAQAHDKLGIALAQTGKFEEAIAHYKRALQINPDYAEAHYDLGVAFENVERETEAIDQYEKALRIYPDYVGAHVNLGNAFLRIGKVTEATEEYEQALRINPNYAEAYSNLGAILQRLGKLPEAVARYEQALRIKPDYVEAHFNLGLALEKLGRTPEAIEHYEQVLKLRPDYPPATKALARLRAGQTGR